MSRPLTAKGAATRERIVSAAATLVRAQGAQNTGLDDIRASTATSKSQLFHYFPGGRADLLYAVAVHEAALVIADQQPELDRLGPPPSWRAWRETVVRKYREQGRQCPLRSLTSQLADSDPRVGPLVASMVSDWHALLLAGTTRAGATAPDALATSVLAAVQGGAGLLIATGELGYLETAVDLAIAPLVAAA
ncbi:TetR/AcrR family transcriptional regulator [Pseudofrankia inefficax]|uniref:Regulatory protein TetR n=1 Tax=Pseudofrankia inefficax (strain DSM 45817 / CECT 9037 / DDB 130130 / EuI1c) TaxID=298654 RepID=E3J2C7_PSEI1|nr:TetR/AcrR family transcriptional regulator [Pseudofrankia inefficax]ADP79299.1 regulatory protein TetR [Pseudofrankia inefficax]